jgi:tripartite ATP-independent transporter DctM subunit
MSAAAAKAERPVGGALPMGIAPKAIFVAVVAALIVFGKTTGLMIALAFMGVPLFVIMGGGATLYWLIHDDASLEHVRFIASDVLQDKFAGSPILVTIPLFTFVGYLMAESKTPERIVRASRAFFGWMPGGLAVVCIIASAFFTTLTGASGVTIVAIGGLLYPALRQQKYPDNFSLGLVTTGGSLGLLLPPSLPILVYSLVAGVPINETFKAGLVPGFLVMIVLGVYSAYIGVRARIPTTKLDLREMGASLWLIKWELAVPVVILGGLGTGLTSLDESAAIAALYTLIIEVFVYKDLDIKKDLPRIARNSMSLAGAVILILAMANSLMNYVDQADVPEKLLHWLEARTSLDTQWKFLIGLNIFLLVIGMLMDGFSAILVAVPLIIPIATTFRMNPFHLGMIFLLNLEIAYVCPPLGLNLYISSFRFERPVVSLYKVVLPFVGLLVITLGLVTYFPRISTILLEGQVESESVKDKESIQKCENPTFEYDRLSCVQADPLNRKPCNARSERVHCLAAPTNEGEAQAYTDYCKKAFECSCIGSTSSRVALKEFCAKEGGDQATQDACLRAQETTCQSRAKKDVTTSEVCGGKPWVEQWTENKARCDAKNGVAPAPTESAAPAPSESAAPAASDSAAPAPSGSESAAPSASVSAAPSAGASAAPSASASTK